MVKSGGASQPTTSRRHEQQLAQDLQKIKTRGKEDFFDLFTRLKWHLSTMWREVWMVAPGKGRREGGFRTSPTRPRRFRATLIKAINGSIRSTIILGITFQELNRDMRSEMLITTRLRKGRTVDQWDQPGEMNNNPNPDSETKSSK